jgi:hypothetical protein
MTVVRLVLDSASRNATRFPSSNDFEAHLGHLDLRDVARLSVVYAAVPFPEPHVTGGRDALQIDGATCTLARGAYADVAHLCREATEALRRDVGPGFAAAPSRLNRVTISADAPFTLRTSEPYVDARGHAGHRPLRGSAAAVLGFSTNVDHVAVRENDGAYVVAADHAPLSTADQVAIVRVREVQGLRSDSDHFDRALAVVHADRAVDTLPVSHTNDPPCRQLNALRVTVCRRDGSLFDTDGRDVTLHLDVVVAGDRQ